MADEYAVSRARELQKGAEEQAAHFLAEREFYREQFIQLCDMFASLETLPAELRRTLKECATAARWNRVRR